MNISCDEESAFDVEINFDPYKLIYHVLFTLNHDETGIHKIKYVLSEDDAQLLRDYLNSKIR